MIRPVSSGQAPDRYGNISITKRETILCARKLVNIPEGFKKRMFVLTIPPGTSEGGKLSLLGLAWQLDGERRGNLYPKVIVED